MDMEPWAYYEPDEQNQPVAKSLTKKAIFALQQALSINPRHPLALHLLIHIMEPSMQPEEAIGAGQELRSLSWGEGYGHLVHMPGK